MIKRFVSVWLCVSALALVACGDDSGDDGSGGTGGSTGGAAGSGGSAGSTGGSAGSTGGNAGSGGTGGSAGSGGAAGSGGSAGGTASECAGMTQLGTEVTSQNVTGTLPAAAGGTLATGTYVLSATKYYDTTGSSPADTLTVSIKAGTGANVFDVALLHGATGCETFTWTVSGTDIAMQMLTPKNQDAGTFGYTATSTELHLFKPSANREAVFTKK